MAPVNEGFNFSTFQSTSIFANVFLPCSTILTDLCRVNTASETTDITDSLTQ